MLLEVIGAALMLFAISLAPTPASSAQLKPAALAHDHYGETFTFLGDFGDAYAQVQLSVSNLGPGSGHGFCRALVVRNGEKPWTSSDRVGSDGWRHRASDGAEMLQVGRCRVRSTKSGVAVTATLDDRELRLDFPPLGGAEKPPKNQLALAGGTHLTEIFYPAVKVTGSLQQRGAQRQRFAGSGYADHSLSTIEPRALAKQWVRFRALRGDTRQLVLGREAFDGSFAPLWMRGGDGAYVELEKFSLARTGPGGKPAFVAHVTGSQSLELRSGELLFRHAPVEELGLLSSVVKPFAGSPVTYTYRATLKGAGGEIPGILEISLAGE